MTPAPFFKRLTSASERVLMKLRVCARPRLLTPGPGIRLCEDHPRKVTFLFTYARFCCLLKVLPMYKKIELSTNLATLGAENFCVSNGALMYILAQKFLLGRGR